MGAEERGGGSDGAGGMWPGSRGGGGGVRCGV